MSHSGNSLLDKTCRLIKNFPEYLEVVVSVARKTDGRHWADLFSAAGRSTEYVHILPIDIFSLLNLLKYLNLVILYVRSVFPSYKLPVYSYLVSL